MKELNELVVSAFPGQRVHNREVAAVKKTFKLRVGVLEVCGRGSGSCCRTCCVLSSQDITQAMQ